MINTVPYIPVLITNQDLTPYFFHKVNLVNNPIFPLVSNVPSVLPIFPLTRRWSLLMSSVFIQQSSDHFLVLSIIFFCFFLKKINARFAKRNCHFNGLILQSQFFRWGKKVGDNLHLSDRFIGVFYFPFHIFSFLSANIRRRLF